MHTLKHNLKHVVLSRRRVGDEFGVAEAPVLDEDQHDGRENQREQVVEEVPDVEKEEVEPVPARGHRGCHGRSPRFQCRADVSAQT